MLRVKTLEATILDDIQLRALFTAHTQGDEKATEALIEYIYPFMHVFIHRRFGHHFNNGTLQTTVILHDFLMKLSSKKELTISGQGALLALSAKIIRHYLADYFKEKARKKRGGHLQFVTLELARQKKFSASLEFLTAYNQAMDLLEKRNPMIRKVLDLKIMGGFSNDQTAKFLNITEHTVRRDYNLYSRWLKMRIQL